MVRHTLVALAAVSLLAAGLGGWTSATAGNNDHEEVLRFLDVEDVFTYVDNGPPGEGPGDVLLFSNQLKRPNGAPAGRFLSTCMNIAAADYKCAGSLRLTQGTIEVAANPDFSSPDPIKAAVVGGTGRYADVGGEMTITPTSRDGVSRLLVKLVHID